MDVTRKKTGKKTKASSVRLNIKHLEFVKEKEKLETVQQVVDFLLERFFWGNWTSGGQQSASVDKKPDLFSAPLDLSKNGQSTPSDSFKEYLAEIADAKSVKELNATKLAYSTDDSINSRKRQLLDEAAKNKSENFYND